MQPGPPAERHAQRRGERDRVEDAGRDRVVHVVERREPQRPGRLLDSVPWSRPRVGVPVVELHGHHAR